MNIILLFTLSGIITGKVFDIDSGEPLQAHIYVENLDRIFLCNSSGNFTLYQIPKGIQNLHISHVGFKEETLEVYVPEIDTTFLSIGLQQIPVSVEPVEVESRIIPSIGTQIMAQEEIKTIPGAEKDLFKALQTLPGVSTASDYLGLFFVRGGDLCENQVLFDNMEILAPYHYFGIGSAFNIDLVENFEFYSGSFPARYGGAISSVLSIRSKEPDNVINGTFSVDLIEADWFYSCPISRNVSFIFSSKKNYLDLLLEKLGIKEGVILPYYLDHQGKISVNSKLGKFFIGGLRSVEGADIKASFADETITLEIDGSGNSISTGWSKKFTNSINCQANLFYSDMSRYLFGEVPTVHQGYSETAEEEVNAKKYGGTVHSQYTTDILHFEIGGSISKYAFLHTGPKVEDIMYKIGAISYSLDVDTADNCGYVYSSQRFSVLQPLICEIGERIDWFPLIKEPVFSPRIKFIYNKQPIIYFAYGHQHQIPPLEYEVEEPKSSYAKYLSLGVEYLIRPTLLGKIEIYNKNYNNLVRKYLDDFKNDGNGYASGIEVSLRRYRIGNNFGWISYAYSASKKVSPYDAEPVVTDVHRPHIFNVVLGRRFKNGFEIGLKFQLATGIANRPVIGKAWRWQSKEWRPVNAPEKSRLPYYQRLDVHLEREFSLLGFHGEFYVTILNLTNHRNIQGYLYNSDYTKRKALYMLPRVPFVGIKLRF